jgi:hypothetical protein
MPHMGVLTASPPAATHAAAPAARRSLMRRIPHPWPLLSARRAARPPPCAPPPAALPGAGATPVAPAFAGDRRSAERLAARLPVLRGGQDALHTKLQHMYSSQQLPDVFIGDIELAEAPGRGWALAATAVIEPGDPILITPPLALLAGPPGRPPAPEDLRALIQRARWLAPARQLLEALCDGPRPESAAEEGAEARQARRQRPSRVKSALERQQEAEILDLLRRMGMGEGDLDLKDYEDGDERDDLEELEGDEQGQQGPAAAVLGARLPQLEALAEGLRDARREGQLGSRPQLKVDPERCGEWWGACACAWV